MSGMDYDAVARERQAANEKLLGKSDRERTLGGQKVRLRTNVPYGLMLRLADLNNAEPGDTFQIAESLIFELIEADKKTLDKVRAYLRENYTPEDLGRTVDALVGDVAGRPTQAPESSGNGRARTGTRSKGSSSSAPAEASTA